MGVCLRDGRQRMEDTEAAVATKIPEVVWEVRRVRLGGCLCCPSSLVLDLAFSLISFSL